MSGTRRAAVLSISCWYSGSAYSIASPCRTCLHMQGYTLLDWTRTNVGCLVQADSVEHLPLVLWQHEQHCQPLPHVPDHKHNIWFDRTCRNKQTILQDDIAKETPGSAAAAALLHMKLLFWAIERSALGQLLKGGRGRPAALEVVRLNVVIRLRVQICAWQWRKRLSSGDLSKFVTVVQFRGLVSRRSSTATRLCTPRERLPQRGCALKCAFGAPKAHSSHDFHCKYGQLLDLMSKGAPRERLPPRGRALKCDCGVPMESALWELTGHVALSSPPPAPHPAAGGTNMSDSCATEIRSRVRGMSAQEPQHTGIML